MSYQPYPSASKPVEQQQRPPAPQSLLTAVKLMYAGAAISVVSLIISLTSTGSLKSTIRTKYPHYTTSQVNHLYTQIIEAAIISAAFGIALWLLMAWANGRGKNWARFTSSGLFVLNTIGVISFFRQPNTGLDLVFEMLTWLVGLGAIFLLWRSDSNAYFKTQATPSDRVPTIRRPGPLR
jgi:hypothetical protein